jgi:hypothetical protein
VPDGPVLDDGRGHGLPSVHECAGGHLLPAAGHWWHAPDELVLSLVREKIEECRRD